MDKADVIKRIHELIDICNQGAEMYPHDKKLFLTDKLALETALNIIDTQDKELKELKEQYNQKFNDAIKNYNRFGATINPFRSL